MARIGLIAVVAALAVVGLSMGAPVEKKSEKVNDEVARAVRMQRVSDCMTFLEANHKDITAVMYFLKASNNFKKESFCSQMISRSDNHDATACYQLFDMARNAEGEPLSLPDLEEAMGKNLENPSKTCNELIPQLD